jgi:hypothetical protein
VEHCLKKEDAKLLVFEAPQVLERVEKMGDLFEPVLTRKQKLPDLAALGAAPEPPRKRTASAQERQKVMAKPRSRSTSRKRA